MFLPKQEILRRLSSFIEGAEKENVHEASYDLCVGDEVYRSEEKLPERLSCSNPFVLLRPGQFALVKTFEVVRVPAEFVGFISIRSEYKFQGLVNVSGFHVDPTFRGNLLFAVQNVGPNDIRLKYREPTFMIMWAQLSEPYDDGPNPRPRVGYPNIPMKLMAQLGGGSITISELKNEVERLNTQVKFLLGIAVALLMAILGVILRLVVKS